MNDAPPRGAILWLDFDPTRGHEQAGRRPAVVLSPVEYNLRVGLALVCPVTSRRKGYQFEVPLPDGLPVRGVALADQLRSIDWHERVAQLAGQLSGDGLTLLLGVARRLLE